MVKAGTATLTLQLLLLSGCVESSGGTEALLALQSAGALGRATETGRSEGSEGLEVVVICQLLAGSDGAGSDNGDTVLQCTRARRRGRLREEERGGGSV